MGSFVIVDASGDHDLAACRTLFREYERSLGVSLCFQGFDRELATLPGAYAAPDGCLLIARDGDAIMGCAALRRASEADGEMKRLYVRDAARGRGVGRALVDRVLQRARDAGYERVVLDTLPTMAAAQAMYAQLGFRDIAPYYDNPVAGTRYLALPL